MRPFAVKHPDPLNSFDFSAGFFHYSPMKIYLDTCALQRPLDSKDYVRILLEAEAVLGILTLCESGAIELISSETLVFEARRIPNVTRKKYAFEVLAKAHVFMQVNDAIAKRATTFTEKGLKSLDALHLATAEEAHADYFCTCDDKFLKKVKKNNSNSALK